MSVVINTNYSATIASNNLSSSNQSLQKSLNRLSSGTKIVNPSDDAGGLAVSMKLSAAAKRQGAAEANIGNSVSLLQTQDGGLKVAAKVLERISELKTMSQDPTKNATDISNYNSEYTALTAQLTAISSETFNGIALFGSSSLTVYTTEDSASSVTLAGRSLTSSTTGVGAVTAATTLSSVTLANITGAIQNVATFRAENGAEQSRLSFSSELLSANKANLEAATSRIVDVDVAKESTQLARWSTLVQAGTAMLAQANGSAQTALRLLS